MTDDELHIAAPDLEHSTGFERSPSATPLAESRHCELLIEDVDWQSSKAPRVSFEAVIFRKAMLARTQMRNVALRDASITNCDMSNADWTAAQLDRVEISSTRLTGFNGSEGAYRDVIFRSCVAPYAVFHTAKFDRCRFEGCNLSNVTFERGTLNRVAFRGCDLTNARFVGANLNDIDVRASRIEGIQVEAPSLRHLTIDALQTAAIAALTGVRIRELLEP